MKTYALTRVDGGVEIMQVVDGYTPRECIAKWHPRRQAEITGAIREIQPSEIPTDRSQRFAWKPDLTIDAAKVAERVRARGV